MPIFAAAAIPIWSAAISGGSVIASNAMGARSMSKASRTAAQIQSSTTDRQLEWEREQDAKNREDFARYQEEQRRQFDAQQQQLAEDRAENLRRYTLDTAENRRRYDQSFAEGQRLADRSFGEDVRRYETRETQLAPVRAQGTASVGTLGQLAADASRAGVMLRPTGDMTRGLPGAPGAPPMQYPVPPPPPTPQYFAGGMANLVPAGTRITQPSITVPPPFGV